MKATETDEIVVVVDGRSYPVPDADTAEKVGTALIVAAERAQHASLEHFDHVDATDVPAPRQAS